MTSRRCWPSTSARRSGSPTCSPAHPATCRPRRRPASASRCSTRRRSPAIATTRPSAARRLAAPAAALARRASTSSRRPGADADDPLAAHHALGQIMTLYHDQPELLLPLSEQPGARPARSPNSAKANSASPRCRSRSSRSTRSGPRSTSSCSRGRCSRSRPCSCAHWLAGPAAGHRWCAPAASRSTCAPARARAIERVTPEPVRPGGRIRIDAPPLGALDSIGIDHLSVPASDARP